MRRVFAAAALALALAARTRDARADEASERQAAATALFDQARQLLSDGKTAEACEKFALSLKYDKRVGTTLNLADCYEKIGKTASAWGRFNEAAALAAAANQQERVDYAKEHAAALAPKLARMRISLGAEAKDVVVTRDGSRVDPDSFGVAVPVDPGAHTIEATAPMKKPWSQSVEIPPEPGDTPVVVPALEDDLVAIAKAKEAEQQRVATQPPFWTSQRIVGAAMAGVGLAGIGVGAIFGLSASSKWSDAKGTSHCDATGCDAAGIAEAKDAKTAGTISTIAFIAGGALVAGGAVVFLLSPKRESAIVVTPTVGGAALRGTF